jgi:hypothetical protein
MNAWDAILMATALPTRIIGKLGSLRGKPLGNLKKPSWHKNAL